MPVRIVAMIDSASVPAQLRDAFGAFSPHPGPASGRAQARPRSPAAPSRPRRTLPSGTSRKAARRDPTPCVGPERRGDDLFPYQALPQIDSDEAASRFSTPWTSASPRRFRSSGRWWSMRLLSTTSKWPSGYGRASITPASNCARTPARAAFRRASSIISGGGSIPHNSPPDPATIPAWTASRPGPHPTSRIRSCRVIPANATEQSSDEALKAGQTTKGSSRNRRGEPSGSLPPRSGEPHLACTRGTSWGSGSGLTSFEAMAPVPIPPARPCDARRTGGGST